METNTPPHYGGKDNPYEPLKIIQHYGLGFEIGNVIKYCLRAGKKDGESEVKDLRKAIDYLTRRVEWLEAQREPISRKLTMEELASLKSDLHKAVIPNDKDPNAY